MKKGSLPGLAAAALLLAALAGRARGQTAEKPAIVPAPAPALLPAPVPARAALVLASGGVDLQRGAARLSRVRQFPVDLDAADRVKTGRDGRAEIAFADGSRVELAPATALIIEEAGPDLISLRLGLGRLRVFAVKRPIRRFEVRTAAAVLAVRGAEFSAETLSDKLTRSELYAGDLAVQDLKGKEVILHPGQGIEIFADRVGEPKALQGVRP